MSEQRALFAPRLSMDEILHIVERWPDQRRYCYWERVGIVSEGKFDDASARAVFERYAEGGG